MAVMEDREFRNAAKKCVEGEMRVLLISELLKKSLGFKEVEDFVSKEREKLRGGVKTRVTFRRHREIVNKLMSEKLRDSKRDSAQLRKERTLCLRRLQESLGGNKKEFEKIKKEVKEQVNKVKAKLKIKHEKELKQLENKYHNHFYPVRAHQRSSDPSMEFVSSPLMRELLG